jgi:hypothetical protein
MPQAKINGRTVFLPDSTSSEEIRRIAHIEPGRKLIQRTREGNYLVPVGRPIEIHEGDAFLDAPARVKGARSLSPHQTSREQWWR